MWVHRRCCGMYGRQFRLLVLMFTYHDRHPGVVKDVVANTAQDRSPDEALAPGTTDDHTGVVGFSSLYYRVTSMTMERLQFVRDLVFICYAFNMLGCGLVLL